MTSIKLIIDRLMQETGLRIHPIEIKIGASKGVLSRAYNNDTDVQSKWIIKIVEVFEDVDANWLFRGVEKKTQKVEEYQQMGDFSNEPQGWYGKEVEHLRRIIEEKDKRLEEKERTINLLMKN
ncbi:hypothetical protein [Draconibacterium mangrovi]|uniref:hypothetical protein n=1 Tax=Draconibacterium mangrovi TaxID=2697469 RepID=UPI0013D649AD|nr:hypothetical protein [Draconibacterium mangrovi]